MQTANVSSQSEAALRPTTARCGGSPEQQLLALIVYNQLIQSQGAETSVKLSQEELKVLRQEVHEALEKAREAQEDSGLWSQLSDVFGGDIAGLASLVVVAAATVASGGTAAVVLGAIALGATLASKYSEELGIPPKVAICIGVAAAVASVASGNIGGGVKAIGTTAQIANEVKFWASGVEAVAQAAGGAAHGVSGQYSGDAIEHRADARSAEFREDLEAIDIDAAIELLSSAVDRQSAAFETTSAIMQGQQQSNQLVIQNFSGAA